MIHLAVPVLLAALLAGAGAYGMVARRNAVLVLIGAELLLNAVNLLLVTVSALPPGGLAAVAGTEAGTDAGAVVGAGAADPLLSGQVLAIFVVTLAAAEIGVALAVVLLLFRARGTVDLAAVTELGEAAPDYSEQVGAGTWPEPPSPPAATPAVTGPSAGAPPSAATTAGPATAGTPTASQAASPASGTGAGTPEAGR